MKYIKLNNIEVQIIPLKKSCTNQNWAKNENLACKKNLFDLIKTKKYKHSWILQVILNLFKKNW